jgi:hypothetical protein
MATKQYISNRGDWENNSFSGGAAPEDGDSVFIMRGLPGIRGTDQSGIKLAWLETEIGYNGNVGTNGDPLIIDSTVVWHRGGGTLFLKSDDGGSTEYTDLVVIDSPGAGTAAKLDGEKIDRIVCLDGKTVLPATLGTVALPSLIEVGNVPGVRSGRKRAKPLVDIGCALVATTGKLVCRGGQVICRAEVPNVEVSGTGEVYYSAATAPTLITVSGKGKFIYNGATTLPLVRAYDYGQVFANPAGTGLTVTLAELFGQSLLVKESWVVVTTAREFGGQTIPPGVYDKLVASQEGRMAYGQLGYGGGPPPWGPPSQGGGAIPVN